MPSHRSLVSGVLAALLGLGAFTFTTAAQAESRWEATHPRRDQVLDRTQNLQRRITQQRREGEISLRRARALRMQDRHLRAEEQSMARRNGGYITPQQQAALNRQESGLSRRVGY